MFKSKSKGLSGASGRLIGLMVVMILLVGVTIPVVQQVIDDSNVTGIAATVLNQVPTILAAAGVVIGASIMD